jgi:hypothetical protein
MQPFRSETDRPISPCKDCKDRSIEPVNCHTNCEAYLKYKKENDEFSEKYKNFRINEADLVKRKAVLKALKKRRESKSKPYKIFF